MSGTSLAIGTKSTTPSSLSTWLTLKQAGVTFDEIVVDTNAKDARTQILAVSPSGRLPCLSHDGLLVWEAVAVCEYAADAFAQTLWPTQRATRAHARAVAMEAHESFADLRRVCPMNLRLEPTFGLTLPPAIGGDVLRTNAIWRECRARHADAGPFLFGGFTIADAMFAPIASIYATYGIPCDDVGNKYLDALLGLPAVTAYKAAAKAERDSPAPTHR